METEKVGILIYGGLGSVKDNSHYELSLFGNCEGDIILGLVLELIMKEVETTWNVCNDGWWRGWYGIEETLLALAASLPICEISRFAEENLVEFQRNWE